MREGEGRHREGGREIPREIEGGREREREKAGGRKRGREKELGGRIQPSDPSDESISQGTDDDDDKI